MSGMIEVNGVKFEVEDNTSSDYALSTFSGYMGFVGEVSERFGGGYRKKIGLVFEKIEKIRGQYTN